MLRANSISTPISLDALRLYDNSVAPESLMRNETIQNTFYNQLARMPEFQRLAAQNSHLQGRVEVRFYANDIAFCHPDGSLVWASDLTGRNTDTAHTLGLHSTTILDAALSLRTAAGRTFAAAPVFTAAPPVPEAEHIRNIEERLATAEAAVAAKDRQIAQLMVHSEERTQLSEENSDLRTQLARSAARQGELERTVVDLRGELESTRAQLGTARAENGQLRDQIAAHQDIISDLRSRLSSTERELHAAQRALDTSRHDQEETENALARSQRNVARLEETVHGLRTELSEAEAERDQLADSLAHQTRELDSAHRRAASAEDQLALLRNELSIAQEEQDALTSECAGLTSEVERLTTESDSMKGQVLSQVTALRAAAEEAAILANARVAQQAEHIENLTADLEDATAARDEAIESLTVAQEELVSLMKEHDQGRADLEADLEEANARTLQLEALLRERSTELDQSQNTATSLAAQVATLESAHAHKQAALAKAGTDLLALQETVKKLEGDLATTGTETDMEITRLRDLNSALQAALREHANAIRAEAAAALAENLTVTTHLDELEALVTSLETARTTLQEQLASLTAAHQEDRETLKIHAATLLSASATALSAAEARARLSDETIAELRNELALAHSDVKTAETQVEEATAMFIAQKQEHNILLSQAQSHGNDLSAQLTTATTRVEELQAALNREQIALALSQSATSELRQTADAAQAQVAKLTQERDDAKRESQALAARFTALAAEIAQSATEQAAALSHSEIERAQLHALNSKLLEQLAAQSAALESDHAALTEADSAHSDEVAGLRATIENLRTEQAALTEIMESAASSATQLLEAAKSALATAEETRTLSATTAERLTAEVTALEEEKAQTAQSNQEEIAQLTARIRAAEVQRDSALEASTTAAHTLSKFAEQLEALQTATTADKALSATELARLETVNRDLAAAQKASIATAERLTAQVTALEEEKAQTAATHNEEIARLTATISAAETARNHSETASTTAAEQLSVLREQLATLQETSQTSSAQAAAEIARLETLNQELQTQLSSQIASAREERAVAQKASEAHTTETARITAELETLKAAQALLEATKLTSDATTEELQSQLANALIAAETAHKRTLDLEGETTQAQTTLREIIKKFQALAVEAKSTSDQSVAAREELQSKIIALESLTQGLQAELATQIAAAQREQTKALESSAIQASKISTLESELAALQSAHSQLIATSESESTNNASRTSALQEALAIAKEGQERAERAASSSQVRIAELEEEIVHKARLITINEERLQEEQASNAVLTDELESAERRNTLLETQYRTLQHQVIEQSNELQSAAAEIISLTTENEELKSKISRQEAIIAEQAEELLANQKLIEALDKELRELKAQLARNEHAHRSAQEALLTEIDQVKAAMDLARKSAEANISSISQAHKAQLFALNQTLAAAEAANQSQAVTIKAQEEKIQDLEVTIAHQERAMLRHGQDILATQEAKRKAVEALQAQKAELEGAVRALSETRKAATLAERTMASLAARLNIAAQRESLQARAIEELQEELSLLEEISRDATAAAEIELLDATAELESVADETQDIDPGLSEIEQAAADARAQAMMEASLYKYRPTLSIEELKFQKRVRHLLAPGAVTLSKSGQMVISKKLCEQLQKSAPGIAFYTKTDTGRATYELITAGKPIHGVFTMGRGGAYIDVVGKFDLARELHELSLDLEKDKDLKHAAIRKEEHAGRKADLTNIRTSIGRTVQQLERQQAKIQKTLVNFTRTLPINLSQASGTQRNQLAHLKKKLATISTQITNQPRRTATLEAWQALQATTQDSPVKAKRLEEKLATTDPVALFIKEANDSRPMLASHLLRLKLYNDAQLPDPVADSRYIDTMFRTINTLFFEEEGGARGDSAASSLNSSRLDASLASKATAA